MSRRRWESIKLFAVLAFLAVAIVFLLLFNDAERPGPMLGEEFQLTLSEKASLENADIQITFREVVEDSRCPLDVVCVREGQARIALNVTIAGKEHALEVTKSADLENATHVEEYIIQLAELTPHPTLNPPQDVPPYTAHLIVLKKLP